MDFMRLTAGLSALYETLNRNQISTLNDEIYKYTNPNALLLVKGLISTCVVSLLTRIKTQQNYFKEAFSIFETS